jgi:uncharacterized membrane protein
MRLLDAVLNGYFLVLCLLLLTGGFVPPAGSPHARLLTEMTQPGPWVAGFLALVAWRRLRDRTNPIGGPWLARQLGTLAERAAARPWAVYLFTALWALLLAAVAIRRHRAFDDNGDLGIFDQAFWNTLHGAFLRSTLVPGIPGEVSILADHFDPLQLALVPLYLAFPSPVLLLVVQSAMLALGAVPLYWLARDRFPGHPALSAIFPVLYLLYLPLRGANRYDYHPSALAPPLLLLALYWMEKERWTRMILFLALAGLLKENVPLAGVSVGLYVALVKKRRRLGLCLAVGFGLWFHAGVAWIVPFFNPAGGYPHRLGYPVLGGPASSLWLAPLRHPLEVAAALFTPIGGKLTYLLYLFGPVAFLPFLSPARLLLGLPFLAQSLLATAPHITSLRTHHPAELIPFVFFAAVAGASTLLDWLDRRPILGPAWTGPRLRRRLSVLLLATSALLHDVPETFYLRWYARTPADDRLEAALRTIPASASVSTWTKILPHVSHRRALYRFPDLGPDEAAPAEFVIIDERLLPTTDVAAVSAALAALPARGYKKVLDGDGIVLLRRRADPERRLDDPRRSD